MQSFNNVSSLSKVSNKAILTLIIALSLNPFGEVVAAEENQIEITVDNIFTLDNEVTFICNPFPMCEMSVEPKPTSPPKKEEKPETDTEKKGG